MKYLVSVLWLNVFVMAWLQILELISLWPSAFYLVIFAVFAVVGTMLYFGAENRDIPKGTVKGVK